MPIHHRLQQQWFLLLFSICTILDFAIARLRNPLNDAEQVAQPQHRVTERKFFKFITRPDIDAPKWIIKVHDEQAIEEGYWFVAPYEALNQKLPGEAWVGPHIYDQSGELIWSGTGMFSHLNTFDFGAMTIGGKQMLKVLSPSEHAGVILDGHYQEWKRVEFDRLPTDMHAFNLIDGGSRALVITYDHMNSTEKEAQAIGFYGKGGCRLSHVGFAEVDVDSPSPAVFSWRSYEHIGLDEVTYNADMVNIECVDRWDVVHANSIDKFADNDYLVSARHTDAVYKISHLDGSIVWRLGGVKSDFRFVGAGNPKFSRQHHAQVLGQDRTHTIVSIFDNAIGTGPHEHPSNSVARGLILLLDTVEWTASVLAEYKHPRGDTVSSRGSFQMLPNGNAFLCWTYSSRISEHSPNGSVVLHAIMDTNTDTYRAFKYPWVGRPLQPPDVVSQAISNDHGEMQTRVYVSWNGATEVDTWALHQAHEDGSFDNDTLISAEWSGFETAIAFEGIIDYVVVEAFDGDDNSLGLSNVVRTQSIEKLWQPKSYQLSNDKLENQDDVLAVTFRMRRRAGKGSYWLFVFGFATCVVASLSLGCSRRKSAMLSRRLFSNGPKYESTMSERI